MADPKAVASLDMARILIAGLPDIARSERVIWNMSRILDKVVVVDDLSLRKEVEVRVKTKCLDSDRLRAMVRVFFNDQGFDLKISPKPPNHVGRPRYSNDGHFGGGHGGNDDHYGRRHRHCSHHDEEDGYSDRSRSPSWDPPLPGRSTARCGTSKAVAPPHSLGIAVPPPPMATFTALSPSLSSASDLFGVSLEVADMSPTYL
ncbi:hypothetical protein ZWY2020_058459 [Hordeum vulgare]|nr:hypothetical protein ZWY2020_058459 [Hordeum vulgare]